MIVAVAKELKDIGRGLKERGYQVVELETYGYPIDAMVYAGNAFQISHVSWNNMPEMRAGERCSYGIFMINARGKTVEMIDEMLRMRCYEHLF